MNQTAFSFDPPASRRTDPLSAFVAELEHTRSGKRARNRDLVRQAAMLFPNGATGPEIHAELERRDLGISYHEAYRRLADLTDRDGTDPTKPLIHGEKRLCKVKGKNLQTWRAK